MEQININFPASQNHDFPQLSRNTQNQNHQTHLDLELENSSFCSTCCRSQNGEFENRSLASLQNYSQFRRNVEFASSRVGERSRSTWRVGFGVSIDGNPVYQQQLHQLAPIVEESFCSTCCSRDLDMTSINQEGLGAYGPAPGQQPRNFNFNPMGNSVVASVDGYSKFEGNLRVASSRISQGQRENYNQASQGETTPTPPQDNLHMRLDDETQVDVDDDNGDESLSDCDCDCSSCCGSESELTFIAPQPHPQQRDMSFGVRSMSMSREARGWSGSVAEFPPSGGVDLDSSRLSTYSGFARGLLQKSNCDALNSSFIPPQQQRLQNTPNPFLPSNHNPMTRTKPHNSPNIRKVRKSLKVGPFLCKICSKPFTTQPSSKAHEYTHMTWAELKKTSVFHQKCVPCDKIFLQIRDYKEHMDMHAGRKLHKCPDPNCQKSFTHRKTLTAHKWIHLSEREKGNLRQGWKHKCYFCAKKFLNPSLLNAHLAVHTGEKPFQCDHAHKGLKCRSSFTKTGNLKLHKRLHLENRGRDFICDFCNKMFTQKINLSGHVKTVHEKKMDFKCPEEGCGKEFGRSGNLKKHRESVHLGLKPYSCPHTSCNKAFGYKWSLNKHLKTVHK